MKTIVILGSARKNSNTEKAIQKLLPFKEYDLIDLLDFQIEHYKYDHKYSERDQFNSIVEKLVAAENIVFATPVYWYSMSGHLKVFFDRLTDLVTVNKNMGRRLKGKSTYLIAAGGEAELPEGFEIPFIRTSKYLDMKYKESFYAKLESP